MTILKKDTGIRTNAGFDMLEASFYQVPQQCKRTLSHFRHFVLEKETVKLLKPFKLHSVRCIERTPSKEFSVHFQ